MHHTEFASYSHSWLNLYARAAPEQPTSSKQSAWDGPGIEHDKAVVWNSSDDPVFKCRLAAVSAPHSGDWLHALPISACGLKLEDEAIRVAVGLRLDNNFCIPHNYVHCSTCGQLVDATGSHSLPCSWLSAESHAIRTSITSYRPRPTVHS